MNEPQVVRPLLEMYTRPARRYYGSDNTDNVLRRIVKDFFGDWAIEELIDLLDNDDLRDDAVKLIVELKEELDLQPLITALETKSGQAYSAVIRILIELEAFNPLVEALDTSNDSKRGTIVSCLLGDRDKWEWTLGWRSDRYSAIRTNSAPQLIDALISGLQRKNNYACVASAEILGKLRAVEAVEPLIETLAIEDKLVQLPAIEALAMIGAETAINKIADFLTDNDRSMRIAALRTLDRLNAKVPNEAIPHLTNIVKKNTYGERLTAVRVLLLKSGWLDEVSPVVIDPLITLLSDESLRELRERAAMFLGQMEDPKAVEPLIKALEEDDAVEVRAAAAKSLDQLGDTQAVIPLVKALVDYRTGWSLSGNKHWVVRQEAARALGQLGEESAEGPLTIAIQDETDAVKKAAAKALIPVLTQ